MDENTEIRVLGELNSGTKRGHPNYSVDAVNIIKHCKSFFEILKPKMIKFINTVTTQLNAANVNSVIECPFNFGRICEITAEVCGVSLRTVQRHTKSQSEKSKVQKMLPRKPTINCDSFSISQIRRVVYDFYVQKQYPTIDEIRKKCMEDSNFPRASKSTFRTWMIEKCKFKYRKIMKKPVYLERHDIMAHRENYLRQIRKYRENGYRIYYCDETWASPDQTRSRCWQTLLTNAEVQEFKQLYRGKVLQDVKGWTGGFVVKGGNGRVIINHIGSDDGFLSGAEDVFISQKDTKDYHRAMNSEHYHEWFADVVKLLPSKSVVVMDQAPYHRKRVEGTYMPNMSWRKDKIIKFLHDQEASVPANVNSFENMLKPALIQVSKKYPVEPKFIVQTTAEKSKKDINILWLPVAHCELNPIELIWAYVKNIISANNSGGIQQVYELSLEALKMVSDSLWTKCVQHVIKVEEEFRVRDRLVDLVTELSSPIIISNDSSSSEDLSDEEYSEDSETED